MTLPDLPDSPLSSSARRPRRDEAAIDLTPDGLAGGRLGAGGLMFFAMTAGTPLTVVAGVVTTGFAVTGVTGLPIAFLLIGMVLGIFAVGYLAMARWIRNAGALYAYISQGLGRPLGVGASWLALISYNLLQVGLYGAIGAASAPLTEKFLHLRPSWFVFAGLAWALTAGLGMLKVDVNGKVLAVLLIAEIAVIIIYSVADIASPAGDVSAATLSPGSLFDSGAGPLLALAVLGFIGFESTVVFAEESREPRRTIPRATYGCIAITAAIYTLSSWAMSLGTGPDQIVANSRASGTDLIFNLAADRIGQASADIGHILFVGSIVAALISFHNTTARYAFALGRERVLPSALGRTSARTGAPVAASLAQSSLALIVIIIYAVAGWDPLVQLFYWGGTIGGIGILTLLAMTSFAVISFFARTDRSRAEAGADAVNPESIWARSIAPAVAGLLLCLTLFLALRNLPTLLGVSTDHPLIRIVPIGILAIFGLGVLWAGFLRLERPAVYQAIGMGASDNEIQAQPRAQADLPIATDEVL